MGVSKRQRERDTHTDILNRYGMRDQGEGKILEVLQSNININKGIVLMISTGKISNLLVIL